jgi:hypothetical protein
VFGNTELHFKIGSDVFETNIGHAFHWIDTGLLKDSQMFTGSTEQKAKIELYEVYQIIFEE